MAEIITVARPYAEAVFRLAKEENAVAKWSDVLSFLAAIVQDQRIADMIGNPKFESAQIENLVLELLADRADAQVKNFIQVLMHNVRLSLLPQIAEQYEQFKAELEGRVAIEVTSAYPLSESQLNDLASSIEKRMNRKVTATVQVDPELIGGVKVTVGDEVIDASVRGKLQAMAASLKS